MTEKELFAKYMIDLERTRAELENTLKQKGVVVEQNETLPNLIDKVKMLVKSDNYLTDIVSGNATEFIDEEIETIRPYAFYLSNVQKVNLKTVKVINEYSFSKCSQLKYLNTPQLYQSYDYSFSECTALKYAYFPSFEYDNKYMFNECSALEIFYAKNMKRISNCIFRNCEKLSHSIMPQAIAEASGGGTSPFVYADRLKVVDFKSNYLPQITSPLLDVLIIRRTESPCTLSNVSFIHSDTTKIYVPGELVESYKTSTNWVALPDIENRVLPLEESQYEDVAWFEQTEEYKQMMQELEE